MLFQPTAYHPYDFANRRHIGPTPEEITGMLESLGFASLEDLVTQTIPANVQSKVELNFGKAFSERALLGEMQRIAKKNKVFTSLIGMGYYGTFTPPVIQRNIFENPAWYTAYTPYQPEISQGRLEALLNFQTMIIDLTGLPVANASLLDEATAAAEAMGMAWRAAKNKSDKFFVDENCHPQNINVMRTRATPLGIELIVADPTTLDPTEVFGAIFQYPNTLGEIFDYTAAMTALHDNGALGIMIADPLALALLREPGAMGADIAVGSTQRFGVPMGYGGPHAAYMACTDNLKRSMPGRIIGVSVDSKGNVAYRLALQTREQHIRREKATSNVCTAQALLAVMASFYGVFHGPNGLKAIAQRVHRKTVRLVRGLQAGGFDVRNKSFFDTVVVNVGARQSEIMVAAAMRQINLRAIGSDRIGISFDEITHSGVIEAVWAAFGIDRKDEDLHHEYRIDEGHYRTSDYMTHPTFHRNRSETEMMRYMRRLADRDLALDRAMIPLGSCTMKLNAAVEMIPVSWPEFAWLHPYAPADQTEGYAEMIDDLSRKLTIATGYDAMSMQPNSGAQGEYAGLLTIAAYHKSRGEGHRNICLIPSSAHGTNPATASMVGWKVIVVGSDASGDIDLDDFRAKAELHGANLAATMITYPSTHGVFEKTVTQVAAITHEFGGQVYIDGANMNAMVGLARPGDIGGDVSHLNLHKTFAIPHGGGGPGMGPIGVKAHLAPFLPSNPVTNDGPAGPVSAAPYGSASILPISWGYIRAMGGAGLRQASLIAILNANYIAKRLEGAFDVLYRGQNDRVAHECIIDTRPFEKSAGITVDDIAKRLIDAGFHAPTMSWPVAGTLMIEPTESESKVELDRFCDAMLNIREEIRAIEEGRMDRVDNPLKNAPHTIDDLVGEWNHPYSRDAAVFPVGAPRRDKFWPAVGRVDNVAGDRNFFCSCPAVVPGIGGH